jgi:amino acid permease
MARELEGRRSFTAFETSFAQLERKSRSSSFILANVDPVSYAAGSSQAVGRDKEESFQGETSTIATGMNLITTMVGAGVLAFPGLFKKGGWVLAPIILMLSALAVIEIGLVLCECLVWVEQRARKYPQEYSFGSRPEKYEDLMEAAFGNAGKKLTFVLFNTLLLLICGAYMILIGTSVEYIVRASWAPYRLCVLVMALVFGPLTLLDDMAVISKLSGIGVVASITYVVCIAAAGFSVKYDGSYSRNWGETMNDIGPLISVM